jgi:hypothetical protein
MAREDGLPWAALEEVTAAVQRFLDPVLGDGASAARWDPGAWTWRTPGR